jgi:hypothetical protein
MLPVCKAAGTISAPAIAGLRTTTGRSGAATTVSPRLSGQLAASIEKHMPRLIAKYVTDTEARTTSRRVRHICTPHIALIRASLEVAVCAESRQLCG